MAFARSPPTPEPDTHGARVAQSPTDGSAVKESRHDRSRGLTKRYGKTLAVDSLSFDVRPGQVTGFLGPNGSGKSTTMRLVMGLDLPNSGQAIINGRPYRTSRGPFTKSVRSSRQRRSTPGEAPTATSGQWLRPTVSGELVWTRCSTS